MTRNAKIAIGVAIILATTTTVIVIRSRNKKEIKDIIRIISEGIGEAGDVNDLLGGISPADVNKIKTDPNAKARAAKAATKIMLAKGTFDDDEDAVYDALRTLNTQAEVKLVSNIIYATKGKTLSTWLGFLSTSEMEKANEIINKLK